MIYLQELFGELDTMAAYEKKFRGELRVSKLDEKF